MKIRVATIKDAKRISYLIQKNTDANPNNYSTQQIKTWKKYNTSAQIVKQLRKRKIFCIFNKNKLVGTIALADHTILGLYVSYTVRKKGIGTQLLKRLEAYAKQNKSKKLTLTSTPSAYKFYLSNGYLSQGKVNLSINGIDFLETRMEKTL